MIYYIFIGKIAGILCMFDGGIYVTVIIKLNFNTHDYLHTTVIEYHWSQQQMFMILQNFYNLNHDT